MRAQALLDSGIDFDAKEAIENATETGDISIKYAMKSHTDIRVESTEDGIRWYDGEYGPYKSK